MEPGGRKSQNLMSIISVFVGEIRCILLASREHLLSHAGATHSRWVLYRSTARDNDIRIENRVEKSSGTPTQPRVGEEVFSKAFVMIFSADFLFTLVL